MKVILLNLTLVSLVHYSDSVFMKQKVREKYLKSDSIISESLISEKYLTKRNA